MAADDESPDNASGSGFTRNFQLDFLATDDYTPNQPLLEPLSICNRRLLRLRRWRIHGPPGNRAFGSASFQSTFQAPPCFAFLSCVLLTGRVAYRQSIESVANRRAILPAFCAAKLLGGAGWSLGEQLLMTAGPFYAGVRGPRSSRFRNLQREKSRMPSEIREKRIPPLRWRLPCMKSGLT